MQKHLARLIRQFPELADCRPQIEQALSIWTDIYRQGRKALVCGNGGSAADSEHIVGELMKGFLCRRPIPTDFAETLQKLYGATGDYLVANLQGALPTISLVSQSALISAYSNDVAADMVFAQQVYGYGQAGDLLVALSTSGNSANVIQALRVARARKMRTIGLTGHDGGAMNDLCDALIKVPCAETAEVQERHLAIYHALCALLEEEFFSHEQQLID